MGQLKVKENGSWVAVAASGVGVPSGGSQGQILLKTGATDYATGWADIVNLIYPIGSIYMSISNTDPSILFGGTWTQIKDTFLLSAGDTYTSGTTGGEASHTLTTNELPSHTHGTKSLTGYIDAVMMDDGRTISFNGIASGTRARSRSWSGSDGNASYTITLDASHEHDSVGLNASHNNMPPYLVVYMWKRTA